MFPLFKYSSSSITFYFYCVHLLQINFTVNPITPIAYIPWQWSDQFKISWEKRLFSKSHTYIGEAILMPTNSRLSNKSLFGSVSLSWQCSVAPSFTVARDAVRVSAAFYVCVFMNLGRKNGLLTFFFFSKAIVTPTCGPRKKPNHPKSFNSIPTSSHYKKK